MEKQIRRIISIICILAITLTMFAGMSLFSAVADVVYKDHYEVGFESGCYANATTNQMPLNRYQFSTHVSHDGTTSLQTKGNKGDARFMLWDNTGTPVSLEQGVYYEVSLWYLIDTETTSGINFGFVAAPPEACWGGGASMITCTGYTSTISVNGCRSDGWQNIKGYVCISESFADNITTLSVRFGSSSNSWAYVDDITVTKVDSSTAKTLSFNSNGGSACASISQKPVTKFTLPTPTKENFIFDGWYCDAALTDPATEYFPKNNTTYYAKWKIGGVDSSLDWVMYRPLDPGYSGSSSDYNRVSADNMNYRWTFSDAASNTNGYALKYDYEDAIDRFNQSSTGTASYVPAAIYFRDNSTTQRGSLISGKLYEAVFRVYVDTKGDTSSSLRLEAGASTYASSTSKVQGSAVSLSGYNAGEWYEVTYRFTANCDSTNYLYLSANGNDIFYVDDIRLYIVPSETINTTVQFINGTSTTNVSGNAGATLSYPANPTKEGYTFGGWYKEPNFATKLTRTTLPLESSKAYARWFINDKKTNVYDFNEDYSSYLSGKYVSASKFTAPKEEIYEEVNAVINNGSYTSAALSNSNVVNKYISVTNNGIVYDTANILPPSSEEGDGEASVDIWELWGPLATSSSKVILYNNGKPISVRKGTTYTISYEYTAELAKGATSAGMVLGVAASETATTVTELSYTKRTFNSTNTGVTKTIACSITAPADGYFAFVFNGIANIEISNIQISYADIVGVNAELVYNNTTDDTTQYFFTIPEFDGSANPSELVTDAKYFVTVNYKAENVGENASLSLYSIENKAFIDNMIGVSKYEVSSKTYNIKSDCGETTTSFAFRTNSWTDRTLALCFTGQAKISISSIEVIVLPDTYSMMEFYYNDVTFNPVYGLVGETIVMPDMSVYPTFGGWYIKENFTSAYDGSTVFKADYKVPQLYGYDRDIVEIGFENGYPIQNVSGAINKEYWSIVEDSELAHSGNALAVYNSNSIGSQTRFGLMLAHGDNSQQDYYLLDGMPYVVSFWYKCVSTKTQGVYMGEVYNNISLFLHETASGTATSTETTQKIIDVVRNYGVNDDWVKVSVAFTADIKDTNRTSIVLRVSGGSTIYFDDFKIEPYTKETNIVAFESNGTYAEPIISTSNQTVTLPTLQKDGYEHDGWYTIADESVLLYSNDGLGSKYSTNKYVTRPVETKYESNTVQLNGTATYHASWKSVALEEGFEEGLSTDNKIVNGNFSVSSVDAAFGKTSIKYSGANGSVDSAVMLGRNSTFALENGETYVAYAYVKAESGVVNFNFATTDSENVTRAVVALTDGFSVDAENGEKWKLVSAPFTYTAPSYETAVVLTANGTGVASFDGVYVVKAPEVNVASISNGTVTVDETNCTITVTPNAGYQLKVNSLKMDYSGAGEVTESLVFNKGDATALGEGSGYVFSYLPPYGHSFESVTVSAEFVKDTSFGVIASSIRTPVYGKSSGIRFRGRINTETEGKITVGGAEYNIVSYGFMLAPQRILDVKNIDAATGWTLETANQVGSIISDNTDILYDATGKYIDLQVLLYNVDLISSYDMTTKLYVKYLDANGEEKVVYSQPYSRSYNDVYSIVGGVGNRDEKVVDFEEYNEIATDRKFVSANYTVASDNQLSGTASLKYSQTGSALSFAALYDNSKVIKLENNTSYNVTVNYKATAVSTSGTIDLYAVCDSNVTTVGYQKLAEVASVTGTTGYISKTVSFTTGELGNYTVLALGMSNAMTVYFDDIKVINDAVVTFVSERGEAIDPVSQAVGTTFTLPEPTDDTFEFDFAGWYVDPEFTTKFTDTVFPAENTVLYAKWTRNKYVQGFENYPFSEGAVLYGTQLTPYNSAVEGFDSKYVRTGSASFKKPVTTSNGAAIGMFTDDMKDGGLIVGNKYLVSFWMYIDPDSTVLSYSTIILRQTTGSAYGYNGNVATISLRSIPKGTWVKKTAEVTIAEGTDGFSIVHNNANAAVIYYDDFEVVSDYKLTWSDEFDGTGVDLNTWTYNRQLIPGYTQLSDGSIRYGVDCRRNDNPNNTYIAQGTEAQNYTNILNANMPTSYIGETSAADGKYLVIRGLERDINGNDVLTGQRLPVDDVYGYSSASIQTNDKFEYLYGYLEMRCIIPFGKGLWPAYWPCGASDLLKDPYGSEFDIFESNNSGMSFATNLHASISGDGLNAYHFNYLDYKGVTTSSEVESGSGRSWFFNYGGTAGITSTTEYKLANYKQQFHTIGMEWTPEYISFACDGTKFFQVDITSPNWEAFHEQVQIKVSMSVGNVEGSLTDAETQFPAHFVIDYIRLYQRSGVGYIDKN